MRMRQDDREKPSPAFSAAMMFRSLAGLRTRVFVATLGTLVLTLSSRAPFHATLSAQVTFESTVAELSSPDQGKRLKAVQMLKAAAYPEAALPLAPLVLDAFDDVQLEAIGAELNIFLADKIVPKKRVGLVVEVRNHIEAEPTFSAGPSALGAARVPSVVLTSLATASRDPNARVAVEAMYAFGALANETPAADRTGVLSQSGPILAASIGAIDPMLRLAAIRVIGRVFAKRMDDPPIEEVAAMRPDTFKVQREATIQQTAMWALGVMKYDRAVQGLNELFRYHQRGPLAAAALDALAHIGHPSSMSLFEAQLTGKNAPFKQIAIEGLARYGGPSRAAAIQTAIEGEKNDAVLLAAHFANVKLADGNIDVIVESLTRTKLHDQAWLYLLELAPGRTAAFGRHLQDPDERIRRDVVEILGLSADRGALPLLEPLSKDRVEIVAQAAVRAVARLKATS